MLLFFGDEVDSFALTSAYDLTDCAAWVWLNSASNTLVDRKPSALISALTWPEAINVIRDENFS